MQEITVYNKDGDILNYLTQWDKNVVIQFKDVNLSKATYVHFFNCNSKEAMVMSADYKDGTLSSQVPNDILTEPHTITGYIWIDETNQYSNYDSYEHKSVYCFRIMVRKCPKPLNQVYEDQKEFITFDKILSDAKGYALMAQSYAVGDTSIREDENTDNAKYYYNQTKIRETMASISVNRAAAYATNAENSATTATNKANAAATSATNAATSAANADTYAKQAQSYAIGEGGVRPNESIDNAKKYYEQAKAISESFSGALRPMGTVTFANLPEITNAVEGDMYNISNQFTTTVDFKEGSGLAIPSGANVYKTADGKWDILAGTPVTGVKGNSEPNYRKGNVNITPEDIGLGNVDDTADVDKNVASAKLLSIQSDNWRQGNDLPSTYPSGETIFVSNNPQNKFNDVITCTIHTIKSYINMVCIQFMYPYEYSHESHVERFYFRESIYYDDMWGDWYEVITSKNIGEQSVNYATSAGTATKAIKDSDGNNISETYLTQTGDCCNNVVTFSPTEASMGISMSWMDVSVINSGDTLSSILTKISKMFKNVRYLNYKLGTQEISYDISDEADNPDNHYGFSLTGSINNLNNKLNDGLNKKQNELTMYTYFLEGTLSSKNSKTGKITRANFELPNSATILFLDVGQYYSPQITNICQNLDIAYSLIETGSDVVPYKIYNNHTDEANFKIMFRILAYSE